MAVSETVDGAWQGAEQYCIAVGDYQLLQDAARAWHLMGRRTIGGGKLAAGGWGHKEIPLYRGWARRTALSRGSPIIYVVNKVVVEQPLFQKTGIHDGLYHRLKADMR